MLEISADIMKIGMKRLGIYLPNDLNKCQISTAIYHRLSDQEDKTSNVFHASFQKLKNHKLKRFTQTK